MSPDISLRAICWKTVKAMHNNEEKRTVKKKKKQKTVYIDDGSTIVDMSALSPNRHGAEKNHTAPGNDDTGRPRWQRILIDYFDSVRMMILPMLVFIGLIGLAFLLVFLIFLGISCVQ